MGHDSDSLLSMFRNGRTDSRIKAPRSLFCGLSSHHESIGLSKELSYQRFKLPLGKQGHIGTIMLLQSGKDLPLFTAMLSQKLGRLHGFRFAAANKDIDGGR